MQPEIALHEHLLANCEPVMDEIFDRCHANSPNFGVRRECFKQSLRKTVTKYLLSAGAEITSDDVNSILNDIQAEELFLTIACASGNEFAWFEFDQGHRNYLERVAKHLASSEADAQDVVDTVYVELYGTRVIDGERVSKFSSYSGRGSLRGWLRTIIWHSLVDLHRTSHDEVSLDEMTENVGEGAAHANFAIPEINSEGEMLDGITRERYKNSTISAIDSAFSSLDNHEKLLLLYYHVENLKLREISQLVQSPDSPLRNWFQRKSSNREQNPDLKVHESTVMRWLEKTYSKVLLIFKQELQSKMGLKNEEIEICMEIAMKDMASPSIYSKLSISQ